jgi:hypothetical protein
VIRAGGTSDLVREATAVVDLHDELIREADANNGEPPADSYERWCAAIDRLRRALPRERQ